MTVLTGLWLAAAVVSGLFWLAALRCFVVGAREMPHLGEARDPPPLRWPSLSVVIAARDEQKEIEGAVRSLLAQDYPRLEVVAVDDRSRDDTGAILDRLAAEDGRLTVVHVKELPPGWLGKNNALMLGARRAGGELMLFTDGDVYFAPGVLRRAVAFAEAHALGHVVAMARLVAPGFFERAFVTAFGSFFVLRFRVWELQHPGTRGYVGMGAFNLVRKDDYVRVGGHATLAMEVADDVKLGLVLRRSGVAQGAVDSDGLVAVRWQNGLFASLRGLVKNAFAGVEWSWPLLAAGSAGMLVTCVAPAAALVFAPWPAKLAALLPWGVSTFIHGYSARQIAKGNGAEGLLFPLCTLALTGVIWWSAASATLRRGIDWRGTFYPLDGLRRGCVRERDWPAARAVGWN